MIYICLMIMATIIVIGAIVTQNRALESMASIITAIYLIPTLLATIVLFIITLPISVISRLLSRKER
jgi:hypothetical protein